MKTHERLEEIKIKTIEELNTTEEKLCYLMIHDPEARNSDFYLRALYMQTFRPEIAKLDYMTVVMSGLEVNPQTVCRARREVQRYNRELEATKDIKEIRQKRAEATKEWSNQKKLYKKGKRVL